jgi:hypothetical protein
MSEWANHVRAQVHLIIDQMTGLRARMPSEGMSSGLSSYYKMLEELFDRDLRLAQLRDESDLLLRAEGEAFNHDPRLQLVSTIFSNVTDQVTGLTKAILGLQADGKVTPSSVDLGLSGIAKGSLYFGLKAQKSDSKVPLLGEQDTLYLSTKRALAVIDDVAHVIEHDDENVSIEEVSQIITDPRVRDAALVAVQRISPTGRRGIVSMFVAGQSGAPAELTPSHRRAIRSSLDRPVVKGEEIEFSGQVREIDLDAKRFELRGIADHQIRDLRCAYQSADEINPKQLIGATVRVRGLVERAADSIPRLMSIRSLDIVRESPDHPV